MDAGEKNQPDSSRPASSRLQLRNTIFEHAEHGLVITDARWRVLDANPAFGRMIATPMEAILGEDLAAFRARLSGTSPEPVEQVLEVDGRWTGEVWMNSGDAQTFPAIVTFSAVREGGVLRYITADFADISHRKGLEADLAFANDYDRLTDLPNRRAFQEQLDVAIARCAGREEAVAVLYLGLDDFHLVNEAFGYPAGDRVLRTVGDRLASAVRTGDLVARLGGDEFAVLLREVTHRAAAAVVAQKITVAISQAIALPEQEVYLSTRIGVGLCPDDATHSEALVRAAATAMSRAKDEGHPFTFYSGELEQERQGRMKLGADLHRALDRGEMALYYQPILGARCGKLIACEALLRWTHPERGPVSPADFIPLAEATGLIRKIGRFVIESAARQAARWDEKGLPPWIIAVNLSAMQLSEPDLVDAIAEAFARNGVDAARFEFEVTESVMVERVEQVIPRLAAIKAMGCSIAIDDFGTGYSSLSYLKSFPADVVKIDRTFVRDIDSDERGDAIAGAVIALAHGLGLEVVAEGVETEAQRRMLTEQGCDRLQGFLFGEAAPARDLPGHFSVS